MSTSQTFECPNCGASLDYHAGDDPTIRCKYCNTSVVVPEELRGPAQSPQVVMASVDLGQISAVQDQAYKPPSGACVLTVIIVITVIAGGLALLFGDFDGDSPLGGAADSVSGGGVASVAFTFGSEGIGQGMFEDARHVGADGEGNIYVGEYSDPSRIQVFDSSGEFLALWTIENETSLVSMAVARDGTLYAVYQSNLWRYDGMSGELLGQVAAGQGFECVALTLDGKLVAAVNDGINDAIIRMDVDGNEEMRSPAALEGIAEHGAIEMLTVDGLGYIYVLPTFDEAVYKFSPDGRFVNRIGGEGDEPGQFSAPGAITVDGQGRVYVTDFKGVQIFDSDGRYLDVFDFPAYGYGLAFTYDGQLLVANGGDKITVFDINAE